MGRADIWFVYLARCADGSLYTGIARDVEERIAAHDAGKGAKYTRGRGPLEVCAVRRCLSKGAALRLELAVKALPRPAKESLTSQVRGAPPLELPELSGSRLRAKRSSLAR